MHTVGQGVTAECTQWVRLKSKIGRDLHTGSLRSVENGVHPPSGTCPIPFLPNEEVATVSSNEIVTALRKFL